MTRDVSTGQARTRGAKATGMSMKWTVKLSKMEPQLEIRVRIKIMMIKFAAIGTKEQRQVPIYNVTKKEFKQIGETPGRDGQYIG